MILTKQIKKQILLAVLLALGGLLAYLFTKTEPTAEKPIQIALTQDILSFDPILTSDIFSEAVLRCVYTTLYDFDDKLNIRPRLAKESVMISPLTWRVTIRDDVKFQNGTRLTADDVVFSITRALHGERTQKMLEVVDRVEKEDDLTVLIHTKEPYSKLMSLFAKAETSIVSKAVVGREGYDFSKPVGAGPFKLISRERNNKISLERFDDCYLGQAASRYLNFIVLVTEQERTAAFLNRDVDILFSVSAYDCEKLKLSQGVKILQTPSTKIEYLSLNNLHPPLNDPRVRLAISYAINRDAIANGVYRNYSTPASSVIPKGIIGYVESPVKYDPAYAEALLEEAGYGGGFAFSVITIDTIRKNTLEYIKLDLAKVGIQLDYSLVTMKTAVDMMNAGEHGGILVGWAFNSDPNGVLPLLLGTGSGKTMNSSNYSNPLFDKLLELGRTESEEERKKEIYEKANRIVIMHAPIIVLQNPMSLSAAHDDIEGLRQNPQGLFQYESIYRNGKSVK